MRNWLSEVELQVTEPIELFCDNNGAISLSEVSKCHSLSKHLDIRFHYEVVERGDIKVARIASEENIAYMPMKVLGKTEHIRFV